MYINRNVRNMFIESLVPYKKSVIWDIHEHSTAQPYALPSENEALIAEQHARFLCALYEQECKGGLFLEGDPFHILFVGFRGVSFAQKIWEALQNLGKTGLVLSRSLYIIWASVLNSPIDEELDGMTHKKNIIPARFDQNTATLTDLNGHPLTEEPQVFFADSLFSSSRGSHIVCLNGQWNSLHAQVQQAPKEWQENVNQSKKTTILPQLPISFIWKPNTLEQIFSSEYDQTLALQLASLHDGGTLYYPQVCMEMLRNASSFMSARGTIVICDEGSPPALSQQGIAQPAILFRGNTLHNPIHFSIFSVFAEQEGWSACITHSPVRKLHYACLKIKNKIPQYIQDSFQKIYNTHFDAEDCQMFWNIAVQLMEEEQYTKVVYFAGRCTEINPRDPRYPYLTARALLALGKLQEAQYYLERGINLAHHSTCNFSFQLGRLAMMRGFPHEAIRYYLQAKTHSQSSALYSNLAYAYLEINQYEQAYESAQDSLRIEPSYIAAKDCLLRIKEEVWTNWQKNKS